ncbi:hypothetical protein ACXR0O_21480 [Verrucomicrobiota bacterium sgz303538]
MSPKAQEFLVRLEEVNLDGNDNLEGDLDALTEPLNGESDVPELFSAIFRLLEAHPDADFGTPGPLVHLIERYRGEYERLLAESVHRAPMHTTLWMVNRILNTDIPATERAEWLSLLSTTQQSASVADEMRELAAEYLKYQYGKG